MTAERFRFDADDGVSIAVHRWLPAGEPRAVLQVVHGMAEHGARYGELATAMTERGWAVYAADHRGHGASVPEGEEPGHMADDEAFARAVADVRRLNRLLADRHPAAPRVLLGHSMGSFMLQELLATDPDAAVGFALSASNGRPPPIAAAGRLLARAERARLGRRGKSALLDMLSFRDFNKKFAPNRTDFDWLSRDPRSVDAYVADPRCGFLCSVQTWIDLLDALPRLTSRAHVRRIPRDTPVYLFAGSRDAVGGMGRGVANLRATYRDAGMHRVDFKLYPGGRHEMLHETNRDEVIADLIDWCERTVAD